MSYRSRVRMPPALKSNRPYSPPRANPVKGIKTAQAMAKSKR